MASWNPLDWFSPASDLVENIGKAIDDNVTSDEERLVLKNELVKLQTGFEIKIRELEAEAEKQRTERWVSDNESGSKLSRNIRPYTLIYLTIVVTLLAVLDGNFGHFVVKGVWVSLFEIAFTVSLGGYFALRTYEKKTGVTK